MTLRCLEAFFLQAFRGSTPTLEALVVDDGSTDGTGDAVRARFAGARVVEGDGSLFWARGMELAESHALTARPEFLLWLNDDVILYETALEGLLETASVCPDAIIVGTLVDPETRSVTYSGVMLSRWHPLRVHRVERSSRPLEVDTFNGNAALVPRSVYERVGPIDGSFSHAQADFDYGLRARGAGFRVIVAPSISGTCSRSPQEPYDDTTLSLGQRWRLMQGPKGLPMRSHARYLRKHGGLLWPLFWAAPYVKLTLSALATTLRRWLTRSD